LPRRAVAGFQPGERYGHQAVRKPPDSSQPGVTSDRVGCGRRPGRALVAATLGGEPDRRPEANDSAVGVAGSRLTLLPLESGLFDRGGIGCYLWSRTYCRISKMIHGKNDSVD